MTIVPPPKTIAIHVHGDLLGDALMKLPFLRAVRGAWPNARITWIAGKDRTYFALDLAPLVTGLIDETIQQAGFGKSWWKIRGPLADRHFDLIIDTQRGVFPSIGLRRVRQRVFVSASFGFLLSDRKPGRGRTRPARLIDQMMELLELAYGGTPPEGPDIYIDPAREEVAAALLPEGKAYIGFAPGSGYDRKCWPLDRFIAVARAQQAAGRAPVFLMGPNETSMVEPIRTAIPEAILPEDEPGAGVSKDPVLSIAVAKKLTAAVANDAGAGHILAAAGTPLVSLFGPTPSEKFAPGAPILRIVRAQDFGGEEMDAIPEEAVGAALKDLLKETAPAPSRPAKG